MRKGAAVLAIVSLALFDCATLEPLQGGTCGNGVVDANEDCDRFAPASLATGKCGSPDEGASACRLKCGSVADCPDGWGCSVSGICREPSGRFAAIGEGVSAGVETMVVGDFDGDRRKDIVGSGPQGANGTAKVRVHYFGDNAALARVNALSEAISSPTVHDFDGDGVDDFAFGLEIGALGMMTGQPDRSLIPKVFPSGRLPRANARPVVVLRDKRPMPSGRESDFLFAGTFDTTSGTRVNAITSLGGKDAYEHELPVGPDGILGDPVWTSFFTLDAASTCGEIAIAMRPAGSNGVIHVFSPCKPDGSSAAKWAPERPPVVIQSPQPLDGGMLVFTRKKGAPAEILFGTRKSDGTKNVYLVSSNGTTLGAPVETALTELPIAAGDLDRDGRIDFVLPTGISLSKGFGTDVTVPVDGGAPPVGDATPPFDDYLPPFITGRRVRWTAARIGNFNGDGLLDFVAASEEQPDIDFFSATPGGFAGSTITTSGPVSRLAVGDFDGDLLTDVGFVERRPGSTEEFDIAIAYGKTNGPPEPPRVVGRTSEVALLDPLGNPDDPNLSVQGLALFIKEKAADGGLPDLALALIFGNGDRQPVAPLLFNDFFSVKPDPNPDTRRDWVPVEVHAAAAVDPKRIDLLALAVGYKTSVLLGRLLDGPYPAAVWVAEGLGGSSFDSPKGVRDLGSFAVTDRGVQFEARTAVGDIDNPKDGLSEFVAIQKRPGDTNFSLRVARPDRESTPIDLGEQSIRRDAAISLLDLDGDGNADLVAILDEGTTRHASIFYNDGNANFTAPAVNVPLADGEDAQGFAFLTTGGAGAFGTTKVKRELAVVTNKRIVLASADPADRKRLVVRDVVTEGGAPLVRPTAIAFGDFDGDGVDDLAIADGGALRILRQLPVK